MEAPPIGNSHKNPAKTTKVVHSINLHIATIIARGVHGYNGYRMDGVVRVKTKSNKRKKTFKFSPQYMQYFDHFDHGCVSDHI